MTIHVGPPVVFTPRSVAASPAGLDTLVDVDTADAATGDVLTYQQDGQWRGQAFTGDGGGGTYRPSEWFTGTGPPTVVPGAVLGDIYVDTVSGILYQLD